MSRLSQTTYQITLSTDGKHTVTVTTDDPVAARGALERTKMIYDEIVQLYGTSDHRDDPSSQEEKVDAVDDEVPVCAVHNAPMVKQQGKFGTFWSCHQRNPDDSWCTYRPTGK